MISIGTRKPSAVQATSAVPSRECEPSKPSASRSPSFSSRLLVRVAQSAGSTAASVPALTTLKKKRDVSDQGGPGVAHLPQKTLEVDPGSAAGVIPELTVILDARW
jgi:hypothetical protein